MDWLSIRANKGEIAMAGAVGRSDRGANNRGEPEGRDRRSELVSRREGRVVQRPPYSGLYKPSPTAAERGNGEVQGGSDEVQSCQRGYRFEKGRISQSFCFALLADARERVRRAGIVAAAGI